MKTLKKQKKLRLAFVACMLLTTTQTNSINLNLLKIFGSWFTTKTHLRKTSFLEKILSNKKVAAAAGTAITVVLIGLLDYFFRKPKSDIGGGKKPKKSKPKKKPLSKKKKKLIGQANVKDQEPKSPTSTSNKNISETNSSPKKEVEKEDENEYSDPFLYIGPFVDALDSLEEFLGEGDLGESDTYIEYEEDCDLQKAIELNKIKNVEKLVKDGADIESEKEDGRTPLHSALTSGHYEIAKLLIKNGAEIPLSLISDDGTVSRFLPEKALFERLAARHKQMLQLLRQKDVTQNLDEIVKLIKDDDTPSYDKQNAIAKLLSQKLVSDDRLKQLATEIPFNHRFFNDEQFNDVSQFSEINEVKDLNGNSVSKAMHIFCNVDGKINLILKLRREKLTRTNLFSLFNI